MPILYSIIVIAAGYFLVRYWDKKKLRDEIRKTREDDLKEEKKEIDRLLKMEEEIPEDYYLKY